MLGHEHNPLRLHHASCLLTHKSTTIPGMDISSEARIFSEELLVLAGPDLHGITAARHPGAAVVVHICWLQQGGQASVDAASCCPGFSTHQDISPAEGATTLLLLRLRHADELLH